MERQSDMTSARIPEPPYDEVFRRALPYLRVRENDVHTSIAYDFASRLLDTEPGEAQVVLPAVLLHDVGYSQMSPEEIGKAFGPHLKDKTWQLLHEREGARLAREILEGMGFSPHHVDHICSIVDGHDTRQEAISPEDAIVKDADKLYRYTPTGHRFVVRTFSMTNGAYKELLGEKIDLWFFTPTARALAREALNILPS